MDEPFVSLDEPTADRLRGLLLEIWQTRPTTVLFVTHDTRGGRPPGRSRDRPDGSPASVQSIVAIDTPRGDRTAPEAIDRIRRQILQPAPVSA
jgi:NitT/TauT family transport system ATP-binding protein